MILVDSSIWIDHFRRSDGELAVLLSADLVCVHPFVLGELALGLPGKAVRQLGALQNLPLLRAARDVEVLSFIRSRTLAGIDIGYVDVHLLAATHLVPGTRIWSRDNRLAAAATKLGIAHTV